MKGESRHGPPGPGTCRLSLRAGTLGKTEAAAVLATRRKAP